MSFTPWLIPPRDMKEEEREEPRRLVEPDPAAPATPSPARIPQAPRSGAPLHFYKCGDCFGTLALETGATDARCDCGGRLDYLGRAKNQRLVVDGLAVPCDSRCISAKGPKCECGCLGANHGSGALVEVERDAGGIPRVTPAGDKAKRHAIAELFRARLAKARDTYQSKIGEEGKFSATAWSAREQLKNAQRFRTQKRRLAAIDAAEAMLLQYERPDR